MVSAMVYSGSMISTQVLVDSLQMVSEVVYSGCIICTQVLVDSLQMVSAMVVQWLYYFCLCPCSFALDGFCVGCMVAL